jgi:hypothetical protein
MADLLLGGCVDAATHARTDAPTRLPSSDLTTHGVIVGMTGSGKTGLGIVLIEECLQAGVPAILIDPKGDLANLCLTFPALAPADFAPWVDPGQAQQAGLSVDEFAAQQATLWKDGLAGWGIGPERIQALRDTVDFAVYTPGSSAGIPLNILGSLQPPADLTDTESANDEIDGYIAGLLGLIGIEADPLASREHILLANLVHDAWSRGETLDLGTLVGRVQQPPIRKLGVLDLDTFYPPADRTAFAMRLNGVLAAPSFAQWMQGDPVDAGAMLRSPSGKPRCAIISTAHLSDEERQSVTALVLSKLVTWMRRQSGSTDLRALLYMDEVAGYLPPVSNPPTKKPIMLLLKQARAFGLGVVLSTQNPVDIDYKALSNAGTWMVGRLQTERDKARLLEGMASAAGSVDVDAVGDLISGLGKREFLLRRASQDVPQVFTTRWAMSYLRGPLTRDQLSVLRAAPASVAPAAPSPAATATAAPVHAAPAPGGAETTPVAPAAAAGVLIAHLDPGAPWSSQIGAVPGRVHRAAAVARVHLRYDDVKADLIHDEEYEAVLMPLPLAADASGFLAVDYDDRDLLAAPASGPAAYEITDAAIDTKAWWAELKRALTDHLVRTRTAEILVNRELGVYGRVGETREEFAARCVAAADAKADAATAALRTKYEARLAKMRDRIGAAAEDAAMAEADHQAQFQASVAGAVGGLLGGLLGGRRSRTSIATEARRQAKSSARVGAAEGKVNALQGDLAALESDLAAEVTALDTEWMAKAERIEALPVPLEKTDVRVADLRLLWVPIG